MTWREKKVYNKKLKRWVAPRHRKARLKGRGTVRLPRNITNKQWLYGDFDKDGVPNYRDCYPLDPKRQHSRLNKAQLGRARKLPIRTSFGTPRQTADYIDDKGLLAKFSRKRRYQDFPKFGKETYKYDREGHRELSRFIKDHPKVLSDLENKKIKNLIYTRPASESYELLLETDSIKDAKKEVKKRPSAFIVYDEKGIEVRDPHDTAQGYEFKKDVMVSPTYMGISEKGKPHKLYRKERAAYTIRAYEHEKEHSKQPQRRKKKERKKYPYEKRPYEIEAGVVGEKKMTDYVNQELDRMRQKRKPEYDHGLWRLSQKRKGQPSKAFDMFD